MEPLTCIINACNSTSKNQFLFSFPTDIKEKKIWLKAIAAHTKVFSDVRDIQLCELHFEDRFFIKDKVLEFLDDTGSIYHHRLKQLTKGSYPSIFPLLNPSINNAGYTYENLQLDLLEKVSLGLPDNWHYVRGTLGCLLVYIGDTKRHVSRSIHINNEMDIQIRVEGMEVEPNLPNTCYSIYDVFSLMEKVGTFLKCEGPTETINCPKVLHFPKLRTIKTCEECTVNKRHNKDNYIKRKKRLKLSLERKKLEIEEIRDDNKKLRLEIIKRKKLN